MILSYLLFCLPMLRVAGTSSGCPFRCFCDLEHTLEGSRLRGLWDRYLHMHLDLMKLCSNFTSFRNALLHIPHGDMDKFIGCNNVSQAMSDSQLLLCSRLDVERTIYPCRKARKSLETRTPMLSFSSQILSDFQRWRQRCLQLRSSCW